jgi:hypothetical protein
VLLVFHHVEQLIIFCLYPSNGEQCQISLYHCAVLLFDGPLTSQRHITSNLVFKAKPLYFIAIIKVKPTHTHTHTHPHPHTHTHTHTHTPTHTHTHRHTHTQTDRERERERAHLHEMASVFDCLLEWLYTCLLNLSP